MLERWRPILQELSKRTGVEFKLKTYSNIPDSTADFSQGNPDFIYSNAFQLINARAKHGYAPIIKDGASDLYGVIVVRRDSAIVNPQQLEGKVVSLPSYNAFGASLVPRSLLQGKQGIMYKEQVAGTHSNAFRQVLIRQADAAGGVYRTFSKEPKLVKNKLRILYQTPGLPAHPISVHPRVPAKLRKDVQKAILNMGNEYDGRRLLLSIPMRTPVSTSYEWDYKKLESLGLEKYYVE